ncbi:MAG TPA: hypothetical protein VE732_07720 [Nitrososphaera sp.]|nr:hypothetical protein [Nitrososphaera sp.]
MRTVIFLVWSISFATLGTSTSSIADEPYKLMEFGATKCDEEMSFLDNIAYRLDERPEVRAHLVVYGGRRGDTRDEVRTRGARMRNYLLNTRRVEPSRLAVVNGGYREKFTVEVWFVPKGMKAPCAKPTVAPKQVRFRKGSMDVWEEPGCFPDAQSIEKSCRA